MEEKSKEDTSISCLSGVIRKDERDVKSHQGETSVEERRSRLQCTEWSGEKERETNKSMIHSACDDSPLVFFSQHVLYYMK